MPLPQDPPLEDSLYDQPSASTFSPYDPEAVQPTSRPAPSSDAPGFGDTSGEDGESQEPEPQDPGLPTFDERYREPFVGLIYLGALTDTFTLWGHEFVVRTLTTEEQARIALLVKPYADTLSENSVYQSAVCAAAVLTVDGEPLPPSVVLGDDGLETTKFPYVFRKWQPPVREAVYNKVFALEVTARRVLEEMGKGSG